MGFHLGSLGQGGLEGAQTHAKLLLEETENDAFDADWWSEARSCLETLTKTPTCWTYQERHMALAVAVAADDATTFLSLINECPNDAALFEQYFDDQSIYHVTLLHMIAGPWSSLLKQGLSSGADLYAGGNFHQTPFMVLLEVLRFKGLSGQPLSVIQS